MAKKSCEECFKYFNSGGAGGYNCAESTMYGITEVLGIDRTQLQKLATPFGGGLGRNGYVCGSLMAGMIVLGSKYGRTNPDQLRAPSYDAATELLEKFEAKIGKLNCREITGLDLKAIDNTGEEKQRVHKEICKPLVKQVCEWVVEMYERDDLA